MNATRPAPWWRDRRLLLTAWFAVNLPLVIWTIQHNWLGPRPSGDWRNYELAVERLLSGAPLYDPSWTSGMPWLYSPVMAWILLPLVPLGYAAVVVLHLGALALLRDLWLIAAVAVSWPWWTDLAAGNLFGIVFTVGIVALRGQRWAEYAFLAACLLMPRPIQFPLAAWLLWQRPGLRGPFVMMFSAHAGAVVLSGFGDDWLALLGSTIGEELRLGFNFGPSRWLGVAWIPIGLLLGAFCLWRGRLGLASLAVSPYLIPSYFLAGFWDWPRGSERRTGP